MFFKRPKKILIEFHGWNAEYITYYFIIDALKSLFPADVHAFATFPNFLSRNFFKKFIDDVKFFLGNILNKKTFRIFRFLGVKSFFIPILYFQNYQLANKYYKIFYNKNNINKDDILKIKINNILIGDILYDSYLKAYNQYTIEVKSTEFKKFFKNFLFLFFYWNDYFIKNDVKAVIVIHATYLTGLPLRIAIFKNKKAIVANSIKIFQLNKSNIYSHREFLSYKKEFSNFNLTQKKKYLSFSKKKIIEKFSGDLSTMEYLSFPSFDKKQNTKKVIMKSNKFKVLIAPHIFSDSPHIYGNMLFPDNYEWLLFLFNISKKTNYEWYIKLHPDVSIVKFDKTYEVIIKLLKNYKNIKWISPQVSHNTLIKQGINAVFTIHGSIGSEYPFFGIPVINASLNNPNIKYNFNFHPENISKLESIVYNLPKLKNKIRRKEILEFFFMHKIIYNSSWLEIDYSFLVKKFGNFNQFMSSKDVFLHLLNSLNNNNKEKIKYKMRLFFNTNNYIFCNKEFPSILNKNI